VTSGCPWTGGGLYCAAMKVALGPLTITTVVERAGPTPPTWLLPDAAPDAVERHRGWMAPHFLDDKGRLLQSIHTFVVLAPGLTMLVDTCVGNDKDRGGRKPFHMMRTAFLDDLHAAGVAPEALAKAPVGSGAEAYPGYAPSATRGGTVTRTGWWSRDSPVPRQSAHDSVQVSPRPPQCGHVTRTGTATDTTRPENASRCDSDTSARRRSLSTGCPRKASRIRSTTRPTEGKSIAISSAKHSCDIKVRLTIGAGPCLVKASRVMLASR